MAIAIKNTLTKELGDFETATVIVDMNNGFVNFGAMANPSYNELVPGQLELIQDTREREGLITFINEGHDEDAREFDTYPKHCVYGTGEAELIPEFIPEQKKQDTYTYYKNSINGMLNRTLQDDIKDLKQLKEIIVAGVCADLCVMDFARTLARYLDELNRDTKVFVIKSLIDTFDAPGHDREEWLEIANKVMAQAGILVVEDIEELKTKEKTLGLRK